MHKYEAFKNSIQSQNEIHNMHLSSMNNRIPNIFHVIYHMNFIKLPKGPN
uniref:Uncharacterized protein n=1 Tax=Rhizophora mucronata TaxID=61149 RepID=A0A2P2NT23_RHIMU